MKLAQIAFRNVRRNRRRSLLSGSAIGLATMFITLMFSLLAGMMGDYRSNIIRYITGHVRIRNVGYDENEKLNPLHLSVPDYPQVVRRLEAEKGVRMATPRIRLATGIYREGETYNGIGLGVDIEKERTLMELDQALQTGRLPRMGQREMALSAGLAAELGIAAGEKLTLLTKNKYMGLSGMTFLVTGIVRFRVPGFNDRFFLMPIDTAAAFLKMPGEATEVLVLLDNPDPTNEQLAAFVRRADAILAGMGLQSVRARPWTTVDTMYGIIRLADTAYNFIALFFFLLGTTVIVNTTMMVIYERMREIGTVAAMGMTPQQIVRLFFLEAFFIAALAALAGSLLGIAIVAPLSRSGIDLTEIMQGMDFEISSVIYPRLNLRSTLLVFLYSVAVSSLASFIPSRRAARIEPVEALRAV